MHDTFLIDQIWVKVQEICKENKIEKLTKVVVTVNNNSHVNKENLYNHITKCNSKLVDENIKIVVERQPIEEQTAIIESLEGDVSEA
ncbi:hypothetical protein AAGC94_06400 [Clostridium sporogenes]|uniref:Hydrogenase expression/synthesis hypA family n=2 Tax=Clostridium TaxID=1485 RepID=A0A7X5P6Z5_CLOSG|nr:MULTISPECIES: hypothetical protein [Clostridium]AJD32298.1 hydrogenase expression/synthesis hypA family protein [Clostridium botulinum Prevot_594]AVP61459.1 hypothetical protein C7M79_12460 [Clostridium botulinum]AKC62547.1 hydrogenase expression/synthesis hypA family [Clostridium sporogenes]AKJ89806.1 hypothetical protein CLSPOx_09185 [Clostridium sporogenes]AVP65038.1 hypothetical protein C3B64_12545 [Clostridium botulinum]